jgi:hypothetical protein
LRDIAGHHTDFRFHIAAPGFVGERDRLTRAAQIVAAALVHQRIVPEAVGQFGPARLADQFDVIDVGAAIGPLESTRQRRSDPPFVKPFARN